MKKDLDERLVLINGDNYDQEWHWKDNKEMEQDIIDYFGLNTDDENELNMFFRKVEWDEAGEYVFSGLQERILPLKVAINEEKDGALINLQYFKENDRKKVLETYFDEVVEICEEVDSKIMTNFLNEFSNNYESRQELNTAKLKFIEDKIIELENDGWNTEYATDTLINYSSLNVYQNIYFMVVRDNELTPLEDGDMPF